MQAYANPNRAARARRDRTFRHLSDTYAAPEIARFGLSDHPEWGLKVTTGVQ